MSNMWIQNTFQILVKPTIRLLIIHHLTYSSTLTNSLKDMSL